VDSLILVGAAFRSIVPEFLEDFLSNPIGSLQRFSIASFTEKAVRSVSGPDPARLNRVLSRAILSCRPDAPGMAALILSFPTVLPFPLGARPTPVRIPDGTR
jgi:hypothetical protein